MIQRRRVMFNSSVYAQNIPTLKRLTCCLSSYGSFGLSRTWLCLISLQNECVWCVLNLYKAAVQLQWRQISFGTVLSSCWKHTLQHTSWDYHTHTPPLKWCALLLQLNTGQLFLNHILSSFQCNHTNDCWFFNVMSCDPKNITHHTGF